MKFFTGLPILWLLFILYLPLGIVNSLSNGDKVFFGYPDRPKFYHLAIHKYDGTVFIGAMNHLYKLSSELELLDDVDTSRYSGRDTYNKILVINYQKTQLIVCGCSWGCFFEIFNLSSKLNEQNRFENKYIGNMAVNSENTSTVALISMHEDQSQKLYVAVSYSGYSENLPAIAVRNLGMGNIFEMYKDGVDFNSKTFNTKYRDEFEVNYVYGFEHGRYKYFLTTQRSNEKQRSPYVSKLIRICDNGESLWQGYAEIPIECKFDSNNTYNLVKAANVGKPNSRLATSLNISPSDDVLYAIFSKSRDKNAPSNKPSNYSALCVYSLKTIDEKFTENIRNCFNGYSLRGFPGISLNSQCIKKDVNINSNFCSSPANMPLNGNQPITAASVITYNTLLTAIVTKLGENHTDVFVGTDHGHLKKILVNDIYSVCEQADLTIDEGSPVNSDLLFSPNYDYLYVMTLHNLTRIVSSVNCSKYENMRNCLESVPRYCGWCWYTNECSTKCDCSVGNYYSWFSNVSPNVGILEDSSNAFQSGAVESLLWRVTTLPAAGEKFTCEFKFENFPSWPVDGKFNSKNFNRVLTCALPNNDDFIRILNNRNHSNATLSISAPSISRPTQMDITFFDCNAYTSCETCISSMFKCEWCPMEKKCKYLAAETWARIDPVKLEPQINNINIPSGKRTAINIKTNLTSNICGRNFNLKCSINIEGNTYIKNAFKNNDSISCEDTTFTYISDRPITVAPVSIILEMPTFSGVILNTDVFVYKCQLMASNYYDCLYYNHFYNCRWCQNTSTCEFYTNCGIKKTNSSGSNKQPDKVYVNRPLIKPSQKSKYVDLNDTFFSPKEGFIYGGTLLTIDGEHFKPSYPTNVSVGNTPCLLILHNSSTIQCITDSFSTEQELNIYVMQGNTTYNLTSDSFKYIKDPKRDDEGYNIEPRGIASGGVEILFRNVKTLPTEQLFFHAKDEYEIYNSTCKIKRGLDSVLSCLSPPISYFDIDSDAANYYREMNISFTSNVTNSRTPRDLNNRSLKLRLYSNPKFDYFLNSTVEIDGNSFVIIVGENIDKACQKTDIKVIVGNHTCEVKSISSTQVICRLLNYLPFNFMDGSEQEYDPLVNLTTISVFVGNVSFVVPKQSEPDAKTTPQPSTGIIYCAVIFLIIAATAVVFFFLFERNKVTEALKKLRRTQQQMTRLELRVASECKEAFAELQTQVTTFMIGDSCTHLPILNYHTYMMNVLFPSINDHSIILTGKTILIHKEEGLLSFRELIMNRNFLLSFVRTLENEQSFTMNDRVFVASMIMITLQKDMEYCTDILKTLLAELIEKYMRNKIHPKLLLRKTESIVEKMLTAWFSFLLYKFLKESAGPALLNLFNAIKEHVHRGPVDMITSQARYCLSENKILRHKLDFFSMTIYVNISEQTAKIIELESPIEEVPVQVLDCDTISQFKEKALDAIHHVINYSTILIPSELNVEWACDTSRKLILSDNDSSSTIEGEWRQKNTLRHYGVPNGSILNLISYKETNYRTSDVIPVFPYKESQNDVKHKTTSSFRKTRKKSLTESTAPLIQDCDLHYKEWHLFKPQDLHEGQEDSSGNYQLIPEIYLTRLLATKCSLQKFVEELFNVIFKKNNKHSFPIAIKYLFDFLDDQARLHNITDPEVVHIWKNNCLPLRFWVNLIKNPNFLFDVHKSNIVDSCLSVIAQVFMDSCSTCEQIFTKDSATTKLLYANEIPIYNKSVKKYYADIKSMPKISLQDMSSMLAEESKKYATDFDTNVAIHELSKYAMKYNEKLTDSLKNNESSEKDFLVTEFQRTVVIMSAADL